MSLSVTIGVDANGVSRISDLPDHMRELGWSRERGARSYSCIPFDHDAAQANINAFYDHFRRIDLLDFFTTVKFTFK